VEKSLLTYEQKGSSGERRSRKAPETEDEWGADYKTDKGAGWRGALGRRGTEMDLDDGKSGLPSLLQCLA